MISSSTLIAVLFKVILIVLSNPNIPQDVKDSVFTEITTVIGQERKAEQATSTVSSIPTSASPIVENVVKLPDMTPTLNMTGSMVSGNYVIPLSVTGEGWTKVFYSFIKKDGETIKAKASAIFSSTSLQEDRTVVFEPNAFGSNQYEYKIYNGDKVIASQSGDITIGQ